MTLFSRHNLYLLQNYLLYLIAFLLPVFPRVVPVLIILFGLVCVWLILRGYSRANIGRISITLIGIYVLHLIGMLYSDNQQQGFFDLEVKLSLIAIPLCFLGFRFLNTTNYRNTLRMFYLGAVLHGLICTGAAVFNYFFTEPELGYPDYYFFFGEHYSILLHHSYYSLYANFALIIYCYLHWPLFLSKKKLARLKDLFIPLFLSITIVMSASKTGMIAWLVLIVAVCLLFVKETSRKWMPIAVLFLIIGGLATLFIASPPFKAVMNNVIKVAQADEPDPKLRESTSVRALIYQSAWDLVTTQKWFGQGTGDYQDALDQKYIQSEYAIHVERHYNAHNLFLQSWISVGLPGLLLTVLVFVLMFEQGARNVDWLYLGFAASFLFISMTESTFNVQAGVVFFSFFAVIFARRSDYFPPETDESLNADLPEALL